MDFKDHYATLGVPPSASAQEIKRAYRKLARRYHPDVSKLPDAEARFKEVAEAHEALIDPERRAAYDELVRERQRPPPAASGQTQGFDGFDGHRRRRGPMNGTASGPEDTDDDDGIDSDFLASLFARARHAPMRGLDQRASLLIDLKDAYRGAQRTLSLQRPGVDEAGQPQLQTQKIDVQIPVGIRAGQQLRLAGQGGAGQGGAPAGDLYLEIGFLPHPVFQVEGDDVSFDLPVAPWEAALGATVTVPTPDGQVQLTVPAGSSRGRRLRLKGRGLPARVVPGAAAGAAASTAASTAPDRAAGAAGDLYAVLSLSLPPAESAPQQEAYGALARAFSAYNPRAALEA